jgi:probable phosphoglycerate mutase
MTRIGIVRHGSTSWNKEGRAQGSSDIPLDDDGLSAAYKLAERIKNEDWDLVYSSNLLRAKLTAEFLAKKTKINEVHLDVRLREAGGGMIEGTTEEERILKWGNNWRDLDLGIESTDSVVARGLSILEEIIQKYENKNILIVSHGSIIRQLLKNLVPDFNMEEHLENTSLTKLVFAKNEWNCELYNCTRHLNEE